ncbi:MAG: MBL fold metallo-hydrolase [Nanoarchaeota archaeon]|nr:MBL fold metallo-hydrolase [Nanoarchaeota archaeon]
MNIGNLKIQWLGHSGFLIAGSKRIIFDPFNIKRNPGKADYLFITHEHFDHCSIADIQKVADTGTIVFTASECVSKVTKIKVRNIVQLQPNTTKEFEDITIETIPAYNIDKFRAPGMPFHPKEDGKLGFIVTFDGKRIYHAGDTDATPEMLQLQNIDLALIPISGKYVMTTEEAAEAVNTFKPKLAIPMHFGDVVGTIEDAERFKGLCQVPVEILQIEEN